MHVVKLTCPNISEFPNFLLRQTQDEKGKWNDYQFVFNEDIADCDYWIVYDILPKKETCRCNPKNLIFITGEPPHIGGYAGVFLKQFNHIITCHGDIRGSNVYSRQQALAWFINKGYIELSQMQLVGKTKTISLITSKRDDMRYRFALKLKKHFGDEIDLFGNGIRPVADKWDALAPYKYSVVMENGRYDDYFTEKLSDCFLAFTYPLYHGCPNIRTGGYFPEPSMTLINIGDPDNAIDLIERVIRGGFWESRLQQIIKSRNRVLDQHNLFPMLVRYIETHAERFGNLDEWLVITLEDKGRFIKDKTIFLKRMIRRLKDEY